MNIGLARKSISQISTISLAFLFARIVVIVSDNMECKSMSYYRKWALFDNNEVFLFDTRP